MPVPLPAEPSHRPPPQHVLKFEKFRKSKHVRNDALRAFVQSFAKLHGHLHANFRSERNLKVEKSPENDYGMPRMRPYKTRD